MQKSPNSFLINCTEKIPDGYTADRYAQKQTFYVKRYNVWHVKFRCITSSNASPIRLMHTGEYGRHFN